MTRSDEEKNPEGCLRIMGILIIIAIILMFMLSSCSVKKTCPGETPWRWSEIQSLTHE
tara:strand:- start:849 stop:1022 length:174 start_codon:yes stop_codon:yes gene_type:complete